MRDLFDTIFLVAAIDSILAYGLAFARHAGPTGREVVDVCGRAPLLDGVVGVFTWIPWVVAFLGRGWPGLAGAVVGELIAFHVWAVGHQLIHREPVNGPPIADLLRQCVRPWRTRLALWATALALPAVLLVRLAQVALYPIGVALLRFPPLPAGNWVRCGRPDGRVGHDLAWGLYGDYVTSIHTLGGQMLRVVASLWSPVRVSGGQDAGAP